MQAAYSVLDWLCLKVPGLRARADLSQPINERQRQVRQEKVTALLKQAMTDPRRERELVRHLRQALALDEEQIRAVLWEWPRAVMTSALPMMLRRLETRWTTASGSSDRFVPDLPFPEHAPQALFSDLNLPEVTVVAPGRRKQGDPIEYGMPIVQALTEFPPGRASRRFAVEHYSEWHWVPLPEPDESGRFSADVNEFIPVSEAAGTIQVGGESTARPLLRPWRLELRLADRQQQQSNARPTWRTQITASSVPWGFELPETVPGARLVNGLHFHTAALGNEIEAARGVIGAVATNGDAETEVGLIRMVDGKPEPVALGFRAPVDAVQITLREDAVPRFSELSPEARRAALTAWFEEQVIGDPDLRQEGSEFSLGWLTMLYIAALAGVSSARGTNLLDLEEAVAAVDSAGVAVSLERALDAVFVADDVDPAQDDTRGIARLRALIHNGDVANRLSELGHRLAAVDVAALDQWLPRVIAATIGVAFREAFQRLCPNIEAESLIIDLDAWIEPAPPTGITNVWLSEQDVGSGGTVEEIRRAASADPGRVGRLLTAALAPTDYEVVDWSVRRALLAAREKGLLADALADVRAARSGAETVSAIRTLRSALRTEGIAPDHAVVSSLNLRVLRPGSSEVTDAALLQALNLWDSMEERLGVELDARSVAYAMSSAPGAALTLEQFYSLLWPRGRAARGSGRSSYSRFSALPSFDPLLLRDVMSETVTEIEFPGDGAVDAREILSRTGAVRVSTRNGSSDTFQALILELIGEPISVGSVMAYPRTTGVGRTGHGAWVTFELPEALS
jgi:hypothetical protein